MMDQAKLGCLETQKVTTPHFSESKFPAIDSVTLRRIQTDLIFSPLPCPLPPTFFFFSLDNRCQCLFKLLMINCEHCTVKNSQSHFSKPSEM